MPIVAVNLSQKTFGELMTFVANGAYASPEQFLEIAAFNQLALERGLTPEELLKGIHHPAAGAQTSVPTRAAGQVAEQVASGAPKRRSPIRASKTLGIDVEAVEVGQLLARFSLEQIAALPTVLDVGSAEAGKDRIWGQVNRLFPLKLTCRWVAVEASTTGAWPTIHQLTDRLADDAATLGTVLQKADERGGRKREDMLGTGLPRRANIQSRDRFLSQFVARVTRADHVYPGAVWHYGLAVFDSDKLRLTKSGHALACLANPVLDEPLELASKTLSDDERAFFLRQVLERIPAEREDFIVVLRAISAGNCAPESLFAAIRAEFPGEWTGLAFRTHVYGTLARLADLGLLNREWSGRNVQYRLPGTAAALLS